MSEAKFTGSMEVVAVGNLTPDKIGGDACNGCPNNTCKSPGVLIDGLTREAVKLLYEKCEIVPVGTIEKLAKLEEINAVMLKALEAASEFLHDGVQMGWVIIRDEDDTLEVIDNAINKAKGQSNERSETYTGDVESRQARYGYICRWVAVKMDLWWDRSE